MEPGIIDGGALCFSNSTVAKLDAFTDPPLLRFFGVVRFSGDGCTTIDWIKSGGAGKVNDEAQDDLLEFAFRSGELSILVLVFLCTLFDSFSFVESLF